MDYKKIYDNLMKSRLSIKTERFKEKKIGVYFEGHHIIPKCKGGLGNSNRRKNNPNIYWCKEIIYKKNIDII